MTVIRCASITDINPISVRAFKLISEPYLFGLYECRCSVMDLKIFFAWMDIDGGGQIKVLSFDQHALDVNGWLKIVERNISRINYGNAILRWKPEFAITRLNASRLPTTIAFDVQHAICLSI